jgi:hypothetical protein
MATANAMKKNTEERLTRISDTEKGLWRSESTRMRSGLELVFCEEIIENAGQERAIARAGGRKR